MADIGLYEAMRTTRAVRKLRPDPVPEPILRRVLQAATWAPSGGNRQPWRIVVVREQATKDVFGRLYQELWAPYSKETRGSFDDLPERSRARAERSLDAADYMAAHLHEAPVILVFCFDPRGLAITDRALTRPSVVGGASLYPAVQNALLACRAEGLGCVLTTMLCMVEPQIRPLLDLPEPWATAAFVPIGYPVGSGHGPLSRKPIEHMVYSERFGQELSASEEHRS